MNDINRSRKKQKITYTPTPEGIERAEKALKRLGFGSKSNFAESILISRSTVTKFFGQKPIQLDSFQKICRQLELSDWKEIAGIKNEERLINKANQEELAIKKPFVKSIKERASVYTIEEIEEEIEQKSTNDNNGQRFLLTQQEDESYIITVKLDGDINSATQKALEIKKTLKDSGETIKLIDMVEGCIKLILEGSEKDIIKLTEKIQSKEISEIAEFPIIDKWELIKEVKQHGAAERNFKDFDFSDADLSNVNFQNANLHECDFSDADLSGADLSGADLSGADLSGADLKNTQIAQTTQIDKKWHKVWEILNQGAVNRDLSGADLRGANLREANLNRANLREADLRWADLRWADLRWADLRWADLRWANLRGADLKNTQIAQTTQIDEKWRKVWKILNQGAVNRNLGGTDLSGANLNGANLNGTNLRGANLNRANLSGADLNRADLREAYLKNTQIAQTTQIDEKWRKVWEILNEGEVNRDLSGADLSGANLREADLSGVNLREADLSGVNLREADLSGVNLRGTDLRGANLSGADLSRANLSRADLSRANLSRADLSRANLSRANLSEANFVETRFSDNQGISEFQKYDLIQRGAIFDDSHGDREEILIPS